MKAVNPSTASRVAITPRVQPFDFGELPADPVNESYRAARTANRSALALRFARCSSKYARAPARSSPPRHEADPVRLLRRCCAPRREILGAGLPYPLRRSRRPRGEHRQFDLGLSSVAPGRRRSGVRGRQLEPPPRHWPRTATRTGPAGDELQDQRVQFAEHRAADPGRCSSTLAPKLSAALRSSRTARIRVPTGARQGRPQRRSSRRRRCSPWAGETQAQKGAVLFQFHMEGGAPIVSPGDEDRAPGQPARVAAANTSLISFSG